MSTLDTLGGHLGLGDALHRVATRLRKPDDPFELGFAVAVGAGGPGVLLSYNPRRRCGGARGRMLAALADAGLPLGPARAALSWLPDDRVSTVLGVEWREGAVEATLYLEELSGGWDAAGIQRQTARLARALGMPVPDWGADPGVPYILAVDLAREGATALKTYRVAAQVPAALASLFGDEEAASGWILQRRHAHPRSDTERATAADAAPPLKVYKTYAYEAGGGGRGAAQELWDCLHPLDDSGVLPGVADVLEGVAVTSVGLRLGVRGVSSGTGYWCLERGVGAALR